MAYWMHGCEKQQHENHMIRGVHVSEKSKDTTRESLFVLSVYCDAQPLCHRGEEGFARIKNK